jgi:hypothetical protein
MSRATTRRLTSLGVVLGLAALWQLASILIPYESVPGEPMVPGWQIVATRTFLGQWNGFYYPMDIWEDSAGRIYVTD